MHKIVIFCVLCVALSYAKSAYYQFKLTEKIGNFSIEILFHTSKTLQDGQNFVMSPFTVWSVLAVMAEGASGNTRNQINSAIRLSARYKDATRTEFKNIIYWLAVNPLTIKLAKINAIFIDKKSWLLPDFPEIAKLYYGTEMESLDFADSIHSTNLVNQAISNFTNGKIPYLVEPSYFQDSQMVLTSALYFKGQWSVPFNASSTTRMPFYDSNGQIIGEVNMMYNRHTYPFSNIRELQARVIELPYGIENRQSMLIMMPNPGVSLEDMFTNFNNVNLETIFEVLRVSKEEYSDDEVDCFIPRFKIKSDIDLTNMLKTRMGIKDLFDQSKARLQYVARLPLYVSKVVHKAEIEVTEDGKKDAGATVADYSNRNEVVQFQANRPFTYIIVEEITKSIVFGGFYRKPSLY